MDDSGSSALASNPALTRISSGANASSAGDTTRSNAARYAPLPEPGGSGTLSVKPAPRPAPPSDIAPLPTG
jgi:hypothetical protein